MCSPPKQRGDAVNRINQYASRHAADAFLSPMCKQFIAIERENNDNRAITKTLAAAMQVHL